MNSITIISPIQLASIATKDYTCNKYTHTHICILYINTKLLIKLKNWLPYSVKLPSNYDTLNTTTLSTGLLLLPLRPYNSIYSTAKLCNVLKTALIRKFPLYQVGVLHILPVT